MKVNAEDLIRDLEAAIEFLRDHAPERLAKLEKDNPQLAETDLYELYRTQLLEGLKTVNPEVVASVAYRSFLELRRKRTGFNPDHLGTG